jgi:hypothetical protein
VSAGDEFAPEVREERDVRHLLILTLLCVVALTTLATYLPDMLKNAPKPRSEPTVAGLERSANNLQKKIEVMEQTSHRYAQWKTCVSLVPVNEVGDTDNRFGYNYDERDGTQQTYMSALAVNWDDETPEYAFLKFARRDGCQSQPPQPGGTAEDASVDGLDHIQTELAAHETATSREARVLALERKVRRLQARAEDLERMSERFDEWESCLSWVPVTEYGDADGHFGYLFGEKGVDPGYKPAITIDTSEWDDPDYEFLAFIGRDRPFSGRECGHEPGEGVD